MLLTTLGTQHQILRVVHLIIIYATHCHLNGTCGDVIDKLAVVADYHHSLAVVDEELLEPADRLDIEVVRRLIEQQHIRVTQQHLRKLDTHAPSTAELTCLAVEILALESKTKQSLLHILLKMSHVNGIELLTLGSHLLNESHVVITLVIGTRCKLVVHTVKLGLHLIQVSESLRRLLKDSTAILGHQMLGQIGYYGILRRRDHSTGSSAHTRKNLKQGTLSGTVLAHKRNTILLINHKRHVTEKRRSTKLNRQSVY